MFRCIDKKFNSAYEFTGGSMSTQDILKNAVAEGLLAVDRQIVWLSGSVFAMKDGDCVRLNQRRDNGNGWHDVAAFTYPALEQVGEMVTADSSIGLHRNVVIVSPKPAMSVA